MCTNTVTEREMENILGKMEWSTLSYTSGSFNNMK